MNFEEIKKQLAPILRGPTEAVIRESKREITLADVMLELAYVRQDIAALRSDLAVTFALDEFDAKRRQMSDELTDKVMKRIAAEERVRKMMEG